MLADKPAQSTATTSFVRYQPLGPILAVMPWNFPFWQVFRLAAPALMAGNVVLLKHASNVPQCALAIEDIIRRAGFPDGAFQTLLIPPGQVQRVLDDPRVAAVSLTGSEQAGRSIAAAAGRQIKKAVLELGGSDPFIVMPSADMRAAIDTAVKARSSTAANRASPPSVSSWRRVSRTRSSAASPSGCRRLRSAIHWIPPLKSGRWPREPR